MPAFGGLVVRLIPFFYKYKIPALIFASFYRGEQEKEEDNTTIHRSLKIHNVKYIKLEKYLLVDDEEIERSKRTNAARAAALYNT